MLAMITAAVVSVLLHKSDWWGGVTGWNPCAVGVEMRVEQSSLPIVEQTPALGLALDNAAAERIQTRKQKARCCVFLGKAGVSVSWSVN